jgi:uncharacterized membrane protein YphA (DoxX/SURF4 family)
MIDMLFNGLGGTDIALTLNRVAVGMFFMFSGYHKLFNAQRHFMLVDELKALRIPAVKFNQWWVPTIEFTAGGAVFIGLLAPLAALGLLVIIVVASATSGRQRIKAYKAIDEADRVDDWLYLPETLYAFMLIMVVSTGAGPYSLDAAILRLIDKPARWEAGLSCQALPIANEGNSMTATPSLILRDELARVSVVVSRAEKVMG